MIKYCAEQLTLQAYKFHIHEYDENNQLKLSAIVMLNKPTNGYCHFTGIFSRSPSNNKV